MQLPKLQAGLPQDLQRVQQSADAVVCQGQISGLVQKLSVLRTVLWNGDILLSFHEEVYLEGPEMLRPERRLLASLSCYLELGD